MLSTWELTVEEIVSSGPDRIIVYEGAEEKLKQLGTGLLEKLGIGGPSWERDERERYRVGMVPVENQLAPGLPSAAEQRRIQPASTQAFVPEEELDYVELEERREREPLRQRRYLDDSDDRYRSERRNGRDDGLRDVDSRDQDPRYDNQFNNQYDDQTDEEPRYRQQPERAGEPRAPLPRREPRYDPREPLDVEPEVIDDPW